MLAHCNPRRIHYLPDHGLPPQETVELWNIQETYDLLQRQRPKLSIRAA